MEVSLINEQVSIRFSEKRHQYRIKVHDAKGRITFPTLLDGKPNGRETVTIPTKYVHRFNLTTSVTSVTKFIGDKQFLIKWAAKKTSEFYLERLHPGIKLSRRILEQWAEEAPNARYKSLDAGASRGDKIHKWIDHYISWQLDKRPDEPRYPKNPKIRKAIEDFLEFEEDWDLDYIDCERIIYDPFTNVAGTLDIVANSKKGLTVIDTKTGGGVYPEMHMQVAAYRRGYFYDTGNFPARSVLFYIPRDGTTCVAIDDEEDELNDEEDYNAFLLAGGIYWWWKSKGR